MGYLQINSSTNQQINFCYEDFKIITFYTISDKGFTVFECVMNERS